MILYRTNRFPWRNDERTQATRAGRVDDGRKQVAATEKRFRERKLWIESNIARLGNTCVEEEYYEEAARYYEEALSRNGQRGRRRRVGNSVRSGYYGRLAEAYSGLGRDDVQYVATTGDGDTTVAVVSAVGAALLTPVLLLVAGFVSRAPSPWRTAAVWSPGVLAVFGAVSLIAGEPATGYVLAVGIGVAHAVRAEPGIHNRSWRLWTVGGLAAYTKVVFLLSPGLAVVAAPLLPAAGIAIIDSVSERRLTA